MENSLTEFVGLICYKGHQTLGRAAIPQGVIEKSIGLALRQGLQIENTRVHVYRRGEQAVWCRPTLVIDPEQVNLKMLLSKYCKKTSSQHGTLFNHTQDFVTAFPVISRKPYLSEYESFISDMLRIWQLPGGEDNLVFLSLSGEEGLRQLVADIELMRKSLRDYVFTEIYISSRRRRKPADVLLAIKSTAESLRRKLSLVQNANLVSSRIANLPRSVYINRFLDQAHYFPEGCFLWGLIAWVSKALTDAAQVILEQPSDLPLLQGPVIPLLQSTVSEVHAKTHEEFVLPEPHGSTSDTLVSLFEALDQRIDQWCRAILGWYDDAYFNAHRHDRFVTGLRNVVVCYDVKRSTVTLDRLLQMGIKDLPKVIDRWRSLSAAIPRNWSILFDGVLKFEGDQEIAFFQHSAGGEDSMSLSLLHVDSLESINPSPHLFRLGLKAGIGEGMVFVAAGQENSQAINHVYHGIAHLTDSTVASDQWRSSALALDGFVREHERIGAYCSEQMDSREGRIHVVDYPRLASEFCSRMSVA